MLNVSGRLFPEMTKSVLPFGFEVPGEGEQRLALRFAFEPWAVKTSKITTCPASSSISHAAASSTSAGSKVSGIIMSSRVERKWRPVSRATCEPPPRAFTAAEGRFEDGWVESRIVMESSLRSSVCSSPSAAPQMRPGCVASPQTPDIAARNFSRTR